MLDHALESALVAFLQIDPALAEATQRAEERLVAVGFHRIADAKRQRACSEG